MRWTRTLRWRVTLTYVGMLALLLLALGIVLDVAIGRVLYSAEQARLTNEARAAVTLGQSAYQRIVNGRTANCTDALSYQQAFEQAIANQLTVGHPAFQAAYLLDLNGVVIAPEDGATPVGDNAPYLDRKHLSQTLAAVAKARQGSAFGPINGATVSYDTTESDGQRLGIILIPVRYNTVSRCVNANNNALGIVEVVTTYRTTRVALADLNILLLLAMLLILVVGVIVGGPLTASALRPLTRMTATVRRIASGDLSQRVRLPHGGDEIGQLADSFDEMIARIERAFAAQQHSEERMRQFIADASHELRTPLTSIRGYMDVLLRGAVRDDPETAQHVLLAVRGEAERMSRLVNDLLTLARLDVGRPLELRRLDFTALIGEAVDQARILAGEREVAMRGDGAGRLEVLADADRLKQVLLILLDNALKYGRQDAAGWVRVWVRRTERNAIVSVSDNGEGIAPDDLPHIFDRFYRAARTGRRHAQSQLHPTPTIPPLADEEHANRVSGGSEGSGLGLPIANAIATALGGSLSVQSQASSGTVFTLELPLAPPLARLP